MTGFSMAANESQWCQMRHTVHEGHVKQTVILLHGNTQWAGFCMSDIFILWIWVAKQVWGSSEWRFSCVMEELLILIHYMAIIIIDQSLPADRHTDQLICALMGRSKQTEPDSSQWCPMTGQEATGTSWDTGNSIYTSIPFKHKSIFIFLL